jgi:phosphoglycolate phosphatase-like HAD superfamily hydrolase
LGFAAMAGDLYWQRKRARRHEAEILSEIEAEEHLPEYQRRRMELIENWEVLLIDRCWPWTKAVLDELGGKHSLVVVTARANRELLLKQLDHLELSGYFCEILSIPAGEQVGQQKASLIAAYLRDQGRGAEGGWMVGDTEADIEAGRRMHLQTAAVLCGIRDEEHLAAAHADYMIDDIRGLLQFPSLQSSVAWKENPV